LKGDFIFPEILFLNQLNLRRFRRAACPAATRNIGIIEDGSGTAKTYPRITPVSVSERWTLMYVRPSSRKGT
jgi:hypothetical protein